MRAIKFDSWYQLMDSEAYGWVRLKDSQRSRDLYQLQDGKLRVPWVPIGYMAMQESIADWPVARCHRLLSGRARAVVEAFAAVSDGVAWAPEFVTTQSGEDIPYHMMILPRPPDLLDPATSTFGPGGPIRWVLRREAIEGRHVFSPIGTSTSTVVSGMLAQAMVEAGVTGREFLPARVV